MKFKITFCIVCMNRLHQLQQTLLQNLIDNEMYDKLEFLILNYNSLDGMDEWMREKMGDHIQSGRVFYSHTCEPAVFNHSHAKNIAFKLAKGDIICNINADHFTGNGFANYVNDRFLENPKIVLTTIDYFRTKKNYYPEKDVYGKVCVKKDDFLAVGGFDERMINYGFEDWDFVNRLELSGLKRTFIDNFSFLKFIPHTQAERFCLDVHEEIIHAAYVKHIDPSSSELIILYNNKQFQIGVLMDNSSIDSDNYEFAYQPRTHRFENSLKEDKWTEGVWQKISDNEIILITREAGRIAYNVQLDTLTNNVGKIYRKLKDSESLNTLIDFNYFYPNRAIMESNLFNKFIITNDSVFGNARLTTNFDQNIFYI